MVSSPTQKTMEELRGRGYTVQKVEHYNYFSKMRVDLFGVGDVFAVHPGQREILLVQSTSAANHSTRLRKALAEPRLKDFLLAGGRFQVWSYKKVGGRWEFRVTEVTPDMVSAERQSFPRAGRKNKGKRQECLFPPVPPP